MSTKAGRRRLHRTGRDFSRGIARVVRSHVSFRGYRAIVRLRGASLLRAAAVYFGVKSMYLDELALLAVSIGCAPSDLVLEAEAGNARKEAHA